MTREGRDERNEERPSETRTGREATPERDEPEDSDDLEDEVDRDAGDEIPLNIARHEDRDPPSGGSESPRMSGATREDRDSPGESDAPALFGVSDDTDEASEPVPEDGTDGEAVDADEEDDEVEPVEVLVQLADNGEIDPWDIDVVRVTDTFLDVLDARDLRTSGRALFYATVLIRMKSDAMLRGDEAEAEQPEPWEQAMAEDAPIDQPDPFASLEQEMDRRLERRRARGMPQTLDELVRDLRDAERDSWWKESREYDTSDSPHGFQRGTQELDYRAADDLRMDDEPTENEVTGNTHQENMDEVIEDVYAALGEHYEAGREEVLYREISRAGGSRVETFLGLLFLSHRGRVHLQQDDLFGDLWIQDPAAASGSEEALAD